MIHAIRNTQHKAFYFKNIFRSLFLLFFTILVMIVEGCHEDKEDSGSSSGSSGGSSSNKKVIYSDPDEGKLIEQETVVAPKIDLTQDAEKSWFMRLIEWIINFLKRIFS